MTCSKIEKTVVYYICVEWLKVYKISSPGMGKTVVPDENTPW